MWSRVGRRGQHCSKNIIFFNFNPFNLSHCTIIYFTYRLTLINTPKINYDKSLKFSPLFSLFTTRLMSYCIHIPLSNKSIFRSTHLRPSHSTKITKKVTPSKISLLKKKIRGTALKPCSEHPTGD